MFFFWLVRVIWVESRVASSLRVEWVVERERGGLGGLEAEAGHVVFRLLALSVLHLR